jgi:hypothetical protein
VGHVARAAGSGPSGVELDGPVFAGPTEVRIVVGEQPDPFAPQVLFADQRVRPMDLLRIDAAPFGLTALPERIFVHVLGGDGEPYESIELTTTYARRSETPIGSFVIEGLIPKQAAPARKETSGRTRP